MKILNLYAGIGGNRKLWGDEHEITAVELNPEIAKIYQDFFPNDKVIVADAHQYLLEHYKEFDFIWSSPPCPTHSKLRFAQKKRFAPKYPSMTLYEEILFLQGYSDNKWVIENVIGWYKPLILPIEIGRHYYWSNFDIYKVKENKKQVIGPSKIIGENSYEFRSSLMGVKINNFHGYNGDKRTLIANMVEPEMGKYILNCALNHSEPIQEGLFG